MNEEDWDNKVLKALNDLLQAIPFLAFLAFTSLFLLWAIEEAI